MKNAAPLIGEQHFRFNPGKRWFSSLDAQAAAKVTTAIVRMEMGNISSIKWFDGLGEYRIDWGPGYRIYLVQEGKRLIILFGGGTKASQKTDIKQVKELLAEYKSRKSAAKDRGNLQWHSPAASRKPWQSALIVIPPSPRRSWTKRPPCS